MSSWEDKALTAALVGAGGFVAAPGLIAAQILGALGFGSLGPGARTAAALIQSLIGNVARGSFFAMLQSAGMGGAGAMALNAIISGVGLTGAALVALYKCLETFFEKRGEEDGADED
ncbi:hypothetical protein E4U59_006352 [Claviceps monticola]|nr:hypothetical protein E4U59_006352 [Claviceps monticola]